MSRFVRWPTAAMALFWLMGPAFAHAHLASADPAADATISAAPTALVLRFTEGVEPGFTGLVLYGPDGSAIPAGDPEIGPDGTSISVRLIAPLSTGSYRVEWHALAEDGHKSTGAYEFVISP